MTRTYTYGPFQSRRLGLSLGINILPNHKICTYNCVYCEIGQTESLVSPEFRIELPPKMSFRNELISILNYFPDLNSISFTGYFGEPTLNKNLLDFYEIAYKVREKIKWIQNKPKLTLFTNSSTLHFAEIRERVKHFDLILAKLDAATEEDFRRTNSPHPETPKIENIINSLAELKKEMPQHHELAIQCLIYDSYRKDFTPNNNRENISKLAEALKKIKPNSVQIYSIARIPANYFVFSIDNDRKKQIVDELKKELHDEDIQIQSY